VAHPPRWSDERWTVPAISDFSSIATSLRRPPEQRKDRNEAWAHPYASVRIDVDIARHGLPPDLLVSGLVYDVDTGLIEVVVPATMEQRRA